MNKNAPNNNATKELIASRSGSSLLKCIQCGACTGSCPSGRRTQLRIRRLLERALMGFGDVLKSDDLWLCTTCYTCFDRCPRDVQPTLILKSLRNIAVQEGFMKPTHQKAASLFCETGHLVPINDETKELRKMLGLAELPPTVHAGPESLMEVKKIIKFTNFRELAKC